MSIDKDVFYHASNIGGIKELLPLSKMHPSNEPVCYFTPSKVYALLYLRDMEINHVTCGIDEQGIPTYHEQFPNQLAKIYRNRSGYIYSCVNSGLIKQGHTRGVWISTQPVRNLKSEFIIDVYTEIIKAEQAGKVRIIRYENLTEKKKKEITQMIKHSILKNQRLYSTTAKSLFFQENFPEAWQAAELEEKCSLSKNQDIIK